MAKTAKRKPAKMMKPSPFKKNGCVRAWCDDLTGVRVVRFEEQHINTSHVVRLRRWLARAERRRPA